MVETDAATSGRHRLTLRPHHADGSATTITIAGSLTDHHRDQLEAVLVDPLLESGVWDQHVVPGQLDIGLIPGVTDTAAAQVMHAAHLLGITIDDASVGRLIDVEDDRSGGITDAEIRRTWANAVIERWALGTEVEPGRMRTR